MKTIITLLLAMSLLFAVPVHGLAQENLQLYGTPTATSALLRLINSTGETITGLMLLPVSDSPVPEAEDLPGLLEESGFPDGAMIGLWCELRPEGLPAGTAPLYDIPLTFIDGFEWTLHSVPVWDISEATICRDANVAWLTYISLSTGEEVSTWLAELNILAGLESADIPLTDSDGREDAPEQGDLAS